MPTSPNPNALSPDTALQNGRFILGEVLGQGGFGITYQAQDTTLHRTLAIKEFFPPGSAREGDNVVPGGNNSEEFDAALETFIGEARILARFSHPHIVAVYEVFRANGTAYMAMEFVRGLSLQQVVEEEGPLTVRQTLDVIYPVCDALAAIHEGGLLHGDIKPANIMRQDSGRIVLLDFGLTRRIEPNRYATVLLTPGRYGTAGYAPIEQYGHQAQLGAFSDIYALAATLYFLLTGEIPPAATDRATGLVLDEARISDFALRRAVAQGMAMQPAERPQTVTAFRELLKLPEAPNPVIPGTEYQIEILRSGDRAGQGARPAFEEKSDPDDAPVWESETIPGPRSPQAQRRTQRQIPRRRTNIERFDTPGGSVFIGLGGPGCCACGCIGILLVLCFIGVAAGTMLQNLVYLVTGR